MMWYSRSWEREALERVVRVELTDWKAALLGAKIVTSDVEVRSVERVLLRVEAPEKAVRLNWEVVLMRDWGGMRKLSRMWRTLEGAKERSWCAVLVN